MNGPSRPRRRNALLAGAGLCLALLTPALAQVGTMTRDAHAAERQLDWRQKVARDARTSFPAQAGALALGKVERRSATQHELAVALLTLGAAGRVAERPRLESRASEGAPLVRKGAILGLGALAASGVDPVGGAERLLSRLLDDPDPEVASCALLALLSSGKPEWRTRARQLAASSGDRLTGEAERLLVFVTDPSASEPTAASELLLDLRWEAARHFGLVDGRAYAEVLSDELRQDPAFLDSLVLLSAAKLTRPAIKDHMLGLLMNGRGVQRLRAVVRSMAPELEKILAADLWAPSGGEEWRALVEEALEARVIDFLPTLFQRAVLEPQTAGLAAGILARSDASYVGTLENGLGAEDADRRLDACRGFLLLGDLTRAALLRRVGADPDPRVRAAGLVTRLRLEDAEARSLASILLSSEAPREQELEGERSALIDALLDAYRFPHVTEFLEEHIASFAPGEVGGPLACLFLRGRQTDTRLLHEALPLVDPGSIAARRICEALEQYPNQEDIDFLAERFPVEGHSELNGILARTLLQVGHPEVMSLVEAAVWEKDWDRSVLAAAVALETTGLRTLLSWIDSPPARVDSEDIRRLGFAIGQWKGGEGLSQLSSRLGAHAGADRPALQGALLGFLVSRTH